MLIYWSWVKKAKSGNNSRITKETGKKLSSLLDLAEAFHKETRIHANFCLKMFRVWQQPLSWSLNEQLGIHSSRKITLLVSKANPEDTHCAFLYTQPFPVSPMGQAQRQQLTGGPFAPSLGPDQVVMGTRGTVPAISRVHGSRGGKGRNTITRGSSAGGGGQGLPQRAVDAEAGWGWRWAAQPGLPDAPAHSRQRGGTEVASRSTDWTLSAARWCPHCHDLLTHVSFQCPCDPYSAFAVILGFFPVSLQHLFLPFHPCLPH